MEKIYLCPNRICLLGYARKLRLTRVLIDDFTISRQAEQSKNLPKGKLEMGKTSSEGR